MTTAILISIVMTILVAATPILLAALGELVVEKSGVLNLGVEGMMLCGAVCGFGATALSGSLFIGFLAATLAGVAAAMIFAVLSLHLTANQVATGLALTIFGVGVSSLIGKPFVGRTVGRLEPFFPAYLSEHPLLRLVFGYDILVYAAIALTFAVAWFLRVDAPRPCAARGRGIGFLRPCHRLSRDRDPHGGDSVRRRARRDRRRLFFARPDADVG